VKNQYFKEFITLADVKNFTIAAELCATTQSSLSRHLQTLERWAGAQLLIRDSHPLNLTPAGEHLLKFAKAQLASHAQFKGEIGEICAPKPSKIAMPYLLATSRLPGWLNAWNAGTRERLSVRTGTILECARVLAKEQVDLSVCYELQGDQMRLDGRRFERVVLDREVIRPYASAALIEAGRASFPGSARRPLSLLSYTNDSFFLRAFNTMCERAPHRLTGCSVLEIQLSDVQAVLAGQGIGVAWLSDSTMRLHAASGLIAVGEDKWDMPVEVVAYRAKGKRRRPKSDVWERIRSTAEST